MKVSVVIPAYNEQELIGKTLMRYGDFLKSHFAEFELIAVNDGSTDGTLDEIKKCRFAEVISYPQNRGKGYAVKRGVLRATGDYIFFTDADGAYAPDNISKAISVFEKEQASVVVGARKNRTQDYPFLRQMMSKGLSWLLKIILCLDISDSQCGFKGFERKIARQIFSMTTIYDFGFDLEVICLSKSLGKNFAVLPVRFVHRKGSRVRPFLDLWRILKDIFKIRHGKVFYKWRMNFQNLIVRL